ncbi:hypothetical protein EWM64_g8544 [Hericium alpestre]|uniref:Uncharacterized protein n=1 Tax=Hericium alpestre TaxID=135208 RepID=A0A4Y9ZPV5_9AGAM|nr:hypothetical protein EWM64_g8544 [Hericium alpestre]
MVRPTESPPFDCEEITVEKYKPAYGRLLEIEAASVHKDATLHIILRHLLSADMTHYEFFTAGRTTRIWLHDAMDSLESASLIRLPEEQLETYGPNDKIPASLVNAAGDAMYKLYMEWDLENKACGLGLPRWHGNGKFCDEPIAEEAISVPPSYATVWVIPPG